MNEELRLAIRAGLAIAQFVAIAAGIAWVYWQGSRFRCPRCRHHVLLTQIRLEGIACTHCDWSVRRATIEATTTGSAQRGEEAKTCRKCGAHQRDVELLRLWDGHGYCVSCVDRASPDLLAYARSYDCLAEVNPFSWWRAIWGGLWVTTVLAGLIALLFGILSLGFAVAGIFPGQAWWDVALRIVVAVGMMFLFAWCFVGMAGLPVGFVTHWRNRPRLIEVTGGEVMIKPPGDRYYELKSVRWAQASGRYDVVECMCWPRRHGVVLFPHRNDEHDQYRTAKVGYLVGLTPDMFTIWRAFLTLAEVTVQPVAPWRSVTQEPADSANARPSFLLKTFFKPRA